MTIICSWCRGEGLIGIVGEKAPFEDRRETHGICLPHRHTVENRWKDTTRPFQEQGRSSTDHEPDRRIKWNRPTRHSRR